MPNVTASGYGNTSMCATGTGRDQSTVTSTLGMLGPGTFLSDGMFRVLADALMTDFPEVGTVRARQLEAKRVFKLPSGCRLRLG
jgi:hypothetical protein